MTLIYAAFSDKVIEEIRVHNADLLEPPYSSENVQAIYKYFRRQFGSGTPAHDHVNSESIRKIPMFSTADIAHTGLLRYQELQRERKSWGNDYKHSDATKRTWLQQRLHSVLFSPVLRDIERTDPPLTFRASMKLVYKFVEDLKQRDQIALADLNLSSSASTIVDDTRGQQEQRPKQQDFQQQQRYQQQSQFNGGGRNSSGRGQGRGFSTSGRSQGRSQQFDSGRGGRIGGRLPLNRISKCFVCNRSGHRAIECNLGKSILANLRSRGVIAPDSLLTNYNSSNPNFQNQQNIRQMAASHIRRQESTQDIIPNFNVVNMTAAMENFTYTEEIPDISLSVSQAAAFDTSDVQEEESFNPTFDDYFNQEDQGNEDYSDQQDEGGFY
jgi:hypothetical protein